ncbi:MAG: hypothetical protein ABSB40_06150 [Nitrososphaeria archaeon]|jgi:hypothetical protein
MAYLKEDKEDVEIGRPLEKVWMTIQKVLASFKWNIEEIDGKAHHIKAKTESGFLSYSTVLLIDVKSIDENKTKVSVTAKTPGTTISTMFDFGRTGKQRINLFLSGLVEQSK